MRQLALLLALLGLALPSHAEGGGPEPVSALARVKARGTLRWGSDSQGGAPYVFTDATHPDALVGFEVELANRLAAALGVKAEPVQGQWHRLPSLVVRGDMDVAINGLEPTEANRREVEFSVPYAAMPEQLTVRRGDGRAPHSLAELRGRRVGTLPASEAERLLNEAGAEVRTYEGGQDDVYADLRLGRTDAVLLDLPITRFYAEVDPALEVLPGEFGVVRYAVALAPGADASLREAIDAALGELTRSGELRRLYLRWGLWNGQTAALLGGDVAVDAPAPEFERWRSDSGKKPGLGERLARYASFVPTLAAAAGMTLAVSLAAMALAVALGLVLALLRTEGPKPLALLAAGYVELFRGTPLLVQLSLLYFGLPELGVELSPFVAGVVALGLNYAAAEAENYRAGLGAVAPGQREAARTLGLSRSQTLRFVIGPQALRVALPPMTNDFIALLKDSSLVSVVTLSELTKSSLTLASATRDHLGLGLLCALAYLLIGLPFAQLARWMEQRLR